jgi:hypothetical protein
MAERTQLQAMAKRVWESLLDAEGHLSDLRNVDGGEDPAHPVGRRLDYVFEELAQFMHEDDCDE